MCYDLKEITGISMNTYLVKSGTNYGEVVHVVNADDESEVRSIVLNNDQVWEGYEIEKVDTNTKGIVAIAGGGG